MPQLRDISVHREAGLFWRMRWESLRTIVSQGLAGGRLRISVFLLVSLVFWIALFVLFYEGFRFIVMTLEHEGTRAVALQGVFNTFFLALLGMLTFSAGIILYTTLYQSEEIAFLLTTSARPGRIALHKLQDATFFGGWGFLLLGMPMLAAYGVASGSPWYFYLLLPPFMLAFVAIPTSVGAIGVMLIVRFLPKMRLQVAILLGVLALSIVAGVGYIIVGPPKSSAMTPEFFQEMIPRLRYSEQRFLPSWWLSSGLLESAHPVAEGESPAWSESLAFLALLVSNAMFFQLVTQWVAGKTLRTGYGRLRGLNQQKRKTTIGWLDRITALVLTPLPPISRGMLDKDIRLFRRDPVQWGQVVIFLGLLTLYFVNIRRFDYGRHLTGWVTVIGFLNVAIVALILSTFTTRFIFPLISLEGRRIWVLGTLPIDRGTVIWGKFSLACLGSLPVCSLLILLSDIMLRILPNSPAEAALHQLLCWLLCCGLSALAVGFGARFPNLREPSPAKIASGFGGTLNLVLSASLIVVVVLGVAAPYCFWTIATEKGFTSIPTWLAVLGVGKASGIYLGIAIAIIAGVSATVFPMRIGIRSFRKMEY